MESIFARFFWGSSNDYKRTHWISWDQICHPFEEGGLGVRRLRDMETTFSMKLWWRLREKESLWANFMISKYCHASPPSVVKLTKRASPTWRRMVRVRAQTQCHMRWSIGKGDAEFWDDIWINDRSIRLWCNLEETLPRKLVRDFWTEDNWDEDKLRAALLPLGVSTEVVGRIMEVPIDRTGADAIRWTATSSGDFTSASGWELVRHHQEKVEIFKIIWCPAISPSMSIFVWRLLANRIPVDAKLQWRNTSLASKCRCCKKSAGETREHLFLRGETAAKIWRYFSNWFPDIPAFPSENNDFEQRIRWWKSHMERPTRGHVNIVIPCLILWSIWTERNNVIHRGTEFNYRLVIERIQNHLQWEIWARKIQPNHWGGTTPNVQFKYPRPRINRNPLRLVIRWQLPEQSWLKINTAGSIAGNHVVVGGGGIIRNDQGKILWGFADYYATCSRLETELKALLRGVEMARRLGDKIWIEVGEQKISSMLETGSRGPAKHCFIVTEIRNILRGCQSKITHIQREGNCIAEFLARQGGRQGSRITFVHDSAPPFVKSLARMDSLGIPNVRRHDGENEREAE